MGDDGLSIRYEGFGMQFAALGRIAAIRNSCYLSFIFRILTTAMFSCTPIQPMVRGGCLRRWLLFSHDPNKRVLGVL